MIRIACEHSNMLIGLNINRQIVQIKNKKKQSGHGGQQPAMNQMYICQYGLDKRARYHSYC